MPTFVVLLRGVNVGKAKRVPMAAFRDLLAGLGYTNVVTLLNSAALATELEVEVPVIVKSAAELAAIVAENPIKVDAEARSRFLVAFTQETGALASLAAIQPLVAAPEKFAIGRHAAYLFCAAGILQSKAGEALLGKVGRAATTRNLATTLKLHALANAGGS
jgi:uncharacterized protein (DUF1697 family)